MVKWCFNKVFFALFIAVLCCTSTLFANPTGSIYVDKGTLSSGLEQLHVVAPRAAASATLYIKEGTVFSGEKHVNGQLLVVNKPAFKNPKTAPKTLVAKYAKAQPKTSPKIPFFTSGFPKNSDQFIRLLRVAVGLVKQHEPKTGLFKQLAAKYNSTLFKFSKRFLPLYHQTPLLWATKSIGTHGIRPPPVSIFRLA